MAGTFHLDVLAPRRRFFSGEAEELVFVASDGEYGVLPGHEPTTAALSEGLLRYRVDGQWHEAIVSDGFVEIMPQYVNLLTMAVELPEEIDVKRAEAAKERAEEKLRYQKSRQEYYQSQAALARALARLKYGKPRH